MGILITPIRAPSCIKNPEGNLSFFRGEDFLRFFPEPFPGAITTATAIITAMITAIIITTATLIIITITATAISGTPIKVKALPFKETF